MPQTQKPGTSDEDEEKIVVGTNEVLLDAVVKDKKGHLVKDLQASDFEVYEDGVRQDIKSFRLVSRESPEQPSEAGTKPGKTPSETAAMTTDTKQFIKYTNRSID